MRDACGDRERWLARLAEPAEAGALTASERATIESHLDGCEGCRAALADQRVIAGILRGRPILRPTPGFAAGLAARLDDASSWLGILDWQVWTFRLAPVALALFLVAVFTGSATSTTTTPAAGTGSESTATIDTWTRGVGESSSVASAVWQDRTSSDALLETMVLGSSGAREDTSVR